MRVSELKTEMDGQFVELRADMDGRFAEFRADMDGRFAQVDVRFVDLKNDMDARFAAVQEQIAVEGEATRRYFDVVVEQFRSEVRLLYDKVTAIDDTLNRSTASNHQEHATYQRARDDHEVRLKALESHEQ